MTKKEYAEYESSVEEFFKRTGIQNLTSGHINCPECGSDWDDDKCPKCGMSRQSADGPEFSWRPCECCGRPEGGDREHATGYNPTTHEVMEFDVCTDCVYYAEYGQLDDMTMMDMEN